MNNIKWKEGAVCYADNYQWKPHIYGTLADVDGSGNLDEIEKAVNCEDFQLNEPRIGDYIEKSELDTEEKYNDAVELFGLFGFVATHYCINGNFNDENSEVIFLGGGTMNGGKFVDVQCKRKLTYNQLMAIGKLKRMMNERESIKRQSEYCRCVKVDISTSETVAPCAGGFSVGYKCEMPTSDLVADKSGIQKAIDKSRAELGGSGEKGRFIIGESDDGLENAIPDSAKITFNPSVNLEQDFKKHIKDIENDTYNAVNKSAPVLGADNDQVKKPNHYQLMEGVESIEIIARSMTKGQWKGFCLGNMLKYRIRAGKKDALQQDIDKANFYGELYEMHKEKCYD
jgi:hypothetical protein